LAPGRRISKSVNKQQTPLKYKYNAPIVSHLVQAQEPTSIFESTVVAGPTTYGVAVQSVGSLTGLGSQGGPWGAGGWGKHKSSRGSLLPTVSSQLPPNLEPVKSFQPIKENYLDSLPLSSANPISTPLVNGLFQGIGGNHDMSGRLTGGVTRVKKPATIATNTTATTPTNSASPVSKGFGGEIVLF